MVHFDRFGDCFEERRLSSAGRRNDQASLTLSDGGQKIHHPGIQIFTLAIFEQKLLVWIERGEAVELDVAPVLQDNIRMGKVDGFDLDQGKVFFAVFWGADNTRYSISRAQLELSDLRW